MKRVTGELYWRHVTGRSLDRLAPHGAGVWTFEDLSATRRVDIELTSRNGALRQDQQGNRPRTGH
nr:hypothetical protein [Mycetohabitans sp. B8]